MSTLQGKSMMHPLFARVSIRRAASRLFDEMRTKNNRIEERRRDEECTWHFSKAEMLEHLK